MQVILLQRVAKLGQMGEVVNVKDGYARNYLLPQGKALRANDGNIKSFEAKKAQLEAQNLETKKEAEVVGAKLDGQTFVVIRSASDAGALYGSVTTRDAAEAATEAGFTVNRGQVVLDRPIKDLGLHLDLTDGKAWFDGSVASTNIITINKVVTASTNPGQIIAESRRDRSAMPLAPPDCAARQLPDRRCQPRQIGAQISHGFLPPRRHFLKDTKELHINRPQPHPAFGIHARTVAPRRQRRDQPILPFGNPRQNGRLPAAALDPFGQPRDRAGQIIHLVFDHHPRDVGLRIQRLQRIHLRLHLIQHSRHRRRIATLAIAG